jgi:two-component system sensor histidine kinase SenX3
VLSSSAVVVDSNDRVLRASAAARAFGLVKGDRLMVSELAALARQVRRDGEIREGEFEVPVPRFGGRTTSFAVRVAPLGGAVGGGGLVLVLAEDQTESRRVEEVRRDFVANTSHELKTPVGALALLAETIEDAADDAEAVRRFAGKMRQEAQRLTNLVQDLITLSRIQAAEPVPDPRCVDLDAVVAEAVDRCRMKANARGIALTWVGSPGLSVPEDGQAGAADPGQRDATGVGLHPAAPACPSSGTRTCSSPRCATCWRTRWPTVPSGPGWSSPPSGPATATPN